VLGVGAEWIARSGQSLSTAAGSIPVPLREERRVRCWRYEGPETGRKPSSPHSEGSPFPRHAFQHVHSTILEREAGSDHEVLDRAGDEGLSRSRQTGDPRTYVDGDSAHIATGQFDLAGVESDPYLQADPRTSSLIARPHRMALAGPSNVARNPSPAVSTSRPRNRASSVRTTA
jgi:hypothetical protein